MLLAAPSVVSQAACLRARPLSLPPSLPTPQVSPPPPCRLLLQPCGWLSATTTPAAAACLASGAAGWLAGWQTGVTRQAGSVLLLLLFALLGTVAPPHDPCTHPSIDQSIGRGAAGRQAGDLRADDGGASSPSSHQLTRVGCPGGCLRLLASWGAVASDRAAVLVRGSGGRSSIRTWRRTACRT